MHFDLGHFVDAQHAIIVEVRLTHAAALDGDFAPQGRGQAEDQATLQLRDDSNGIDRNAGVDRRSYPAQMDLAVLVNLGFDDRSYEAAK